MKILIVFLAAFLLFGCGSTTEPNTNPSVPQNSAAANTANTNASTANSSSTATSSDRAYPTEVRDEFVKSCQGSGGKPDFCACVFEKVQQKYTFEDFKKIEERLIADDPPTEFVEFSKTARAECTK